MQLDEAQPLIFDVALRNAAIAAIPGAQLQERNGREFIDDAVARSLVLSNGAIRIIRFSRQLEVVPLANSPIRLEQPGRE